MLSSFKKKLKKERVLYLKIKVNPGMAKTEVKRIMADGTIKINIASPAEKGKANQALLDFLAEEFTVKREAVNMLSGAGERSKLLKIIST